MGSPCILNDIVDYSNAEDLEEIRGRLQQAEVDQNRLDGVNSLYRFTREDAKEYVRKIVAEDQSIMESRNIALLFRNREKRG